MDGNSIMVLAVGDVGVNREDPDSMFAHVSTVTRSADISFCQLEMIYSGRETPLPHSQMVTLRAHPRNASALRNAGFTVVSYASNHALDYGPEALLEAVEEMKKIGINPIGVGRNIEEARKPHYMDCKGTRIAFLAYCSILPADYWADGKRPGCAPMRASAVTVHKLYEQVEPVLLYGGEEPVLSFAHEGDKAAMIEDIKMAKSQSDIVVVSMHWGIHFKEGEIAKYQKEVGVAAVDAGADIILGHHAHILKPIEIYKGKPIVYSLANFALEMELPDEVLQSYIWKKLMRLNSTWVTDKRYKSYPWPADSRMTMACKILISDQRIRRVSLLPAVINEDARPRFLSRRDKEFQEVLDYMEKISKAQKIDTQLDVEGDEVVLGGLK
jgi:poly-gamma-glutamate synthesis protein (capsule biosynthesis protein)